MTPNDVNRRINILLRHCGRDVPSVSALDGEYLQAYRDGPFKVSKLTAEWGAVLFCISQNGQVVYFSGDPRQDICLDGDWQVWLLQKADAVSDGSSQFC
ncbi:hypothetical protein [Synechococcus sp. PCC 7336]|uniref:hypothetical protein n=1 Tax=Synechococcus sp. PCC 7336 TaxID=195250 RepID=UPI00034CB332|nr:hypothetical protein [Synechococcus sp. PCC 7336]